MKISKEPVWSYDSVGHKPLKQAVRRIGEKRKEWCTKKPCETWQKSHGKNDKDSTQWLFEPDFLGSAKKLLPWVGQWESFC